MKKKIRSITLILLLTSSLFKSTSNQCNEGCLSCSDQAKSNQCLVCDFFNNYMQDDKQRCIREIVENCEKHNYTNLTPDRCIRCAKNFFYAKSSKSCQQIPESRLRQNCRFYDSNQNCAQCEPQFVKEQGKCISVPKPISNCVRYIDQSNCLKCLTGFWFNKNSGLCEQLTTTPNCRIYSIAKCIQCKQDFFITPNRIHFIESQNIFNSQIFLQDLFTSDNTTSLNLNFSECKRTIVEGCKLFQNFDSCKECENGFYLSPDLRCIRFPADRIDNCQVYTSTTICNKCKNSYYLVNNKCLLSTVVSNCEVYQPFDDKCNSCLSSHLKNSDKCVARKYHPIINCKTYNSEVDECQDCEVETRITDDKLGCFKEIQHCGTYIPVFATQSSQNLCSFCQDNYYPSKSGEECWSQSVENCKTHINNTNKCLNCQESFYVNNEGHCLRQNIPNCKQHNPNQNFCAKCENFFYASGGSCAPASPDVKENCRLTNPSANLCTFCSKGYFKEGNNCKNAYSRPVIPNCQFTDTLIDNGCQDCIEDHKPVVIVKDCQKLPSGCLKFRSHSDTCLKCKENYEGNGSGGCKTFPTTGVCIQIKENVFSSFSQANSVGACEKCGNYHTHFLSHGKCNQRINQSLNCEQNEETEDRCKVCKEDAVLTELNSKNICLKKPLPSPVLNCAIHDIFEPSICRYCRLGHKLNSNACLKITDGIPKALLKNTLAPNGELDTFTLTGKVANCNPKFNFQVLLGGVDRIGCGLCQSDYASVVRTTSNRNPYQVHNLTQDGNEFFPSFPAAKACIKDITAFVKKSDGSMYFSDLKDCLYSEYSISGYICVKCRPGKAGKVAIAGKTASGGTITTSVYTISECVDIGSEMTKQYQGLNYQNFDFNILSYETFVGADTCLDRSKAVVFVGIITDGAQLHISRVGSDGSELKNHLCVSINSMTSKVQNCQIHYAKAAVFVDFFLIKECLACRPGFFASAKDSTTRLIKGCQPILNCQISDSPSNSWMNACQSCVSGYAWDYDDTNKNILFHKCVLVDDPSCNVYDEKNKKCKVCHKGFSLNGDNKCVSFLNAQNCETFGSAVFELDGHSPASFARDGSFVRWIIADSHNGFGCSKCLSGFVLFSGSGKLCIEDPILRGPLIDNCKLHQISDSTKAECFECDPGFIILNTFDECVPFSEVDSNCLKAIKISSSRYGCFLCKNGFIPDDNFICRSRDSKCANFIENDVDKGSYCEYCKSDFRLANKICEPIISTDPCKQYNPNSDCITCKDPGAIPHHFTNPFGKKLIKCVTVPKEAHNGLALDFSLINYLIRYNPNTQSLELEPAVCPEQYYSASIINKDNRDMLACVKYPPTQKCLSYNAAAFCDACQPFYGSDRNGNCVKDILPGCQNYHTAEKCLKCQNQFFLNGDGKQCIRYSIRNCQELDPAADRCIQCNQGFWKTADQDCKPFTVSGCLERSTIEDKCITCQNIYYMSGNGQCLKVTIKSNCNVYWNNKDECKTCKNNFFLDTSQTCQPNPSGIPNCVKYQKENVCLECKAHYYVFLNTCKLVSNPVTYCALYSDNGFCAKCDSGHFLKDVFQCKEVIEQSCKEWSDAHNCKSCPDNQILLFEAGNTRCRVSPLTECLKSQFDFNADRIICLLCKPGYFIDSESQCARSKEIIANCDFYESNSKCGRCFEGYVLTFNRTKCVSGISEAGLFCKVAEFLEQPRCTICQYGYFLSNKGECLPCQQDGCAICDLNNTSKCTLCKSGYYMNQQLNCVIIDQTQPPTKSISIITNVALLFCFGISLFFA